MSREIVSPEKFCNRVLPRCSILLLFRRKGRTDDDIDELLASMFVKMNVCRARVFDDVCFATSESTEEDVVGSQVPSYFLAFRHVLLFVSIILRRTTTNENLRGTILTDTTTRCRDFAVVLLQSKRFDVFNRARPNKVGPILW